MNKYGSRSFPPYIYMTLMIIEWFSRLDLQIGVVELHLLGLFVYESLNI